MEATLQAAGKVVHLGDGSTIPLRVRLGFPLTGRGIILHARRLGSRTFHLPMDDSLLLLLVLLCLGDNHKFLAPVQPTSKFVRPLISPWGANSTHPLPPHQTPRLPAYLSSDDERKPSVVLLLPDEGKGHIKPVALPHRRCHLTAS